MQAVIVRKIQELILEGVFKPGDRLREEELAKQFTVSRSPIREALFNLEKQGTVRMEPSKKSDNRAAKRRGGG